MSELDDIRARRAAVTPGVWNEVFSRVNVEGTDIAITRLGAQGEADAAFIAAAPADIDALLAMVDALTGERDSLRNTLSTACDELRATVAERDALAAQLAQAQRELAAARSSAAIANLRD